MKLLATHGNCDGCGRLFPSRKLKRFDRLHSLPRFCPSCLAKEKFKSHLARIEELQGHAD